MSIILAIDPGMTTGYAVYDDAKGTKGCEGLLHSGNLTMDVCLLSLRLIVDDYKPDIVVIENVATPTQSIMNLHLKTLTANLRQLFPKAFWTNAGTWMGTPAKSWRVPSHFNNQRLSAHQRDSLRMALWYITFGRKTHAKQITL